MPTISLQPSVGCGLHLKGKRRASLYIIEITMIIVKKLRKNVQNEIPKKW